MRGVRVVVCWRAHLGCASAPHQRRTRADARSRRRRPAARPSTPAFEGWYKNPDGTFSLSFGYYNRNTDEVSRVPIGPGQFHQPGRRESGPADVLLSAAPLGRVRGEGPGRFRRQESRLDAEGPRQDVRDSRESAREWQIDALEGEAGSEQHAAGADDSATAARRRADRRASPSTARRSVGKPLTINVVAQGRRRAVSRRTGGQPVTLTWFTHQGPAQVTFGPPTAETARRRVVRRRRRRRSASRATTSFAFARTIRRWSPQDTRSAAGPTRSSK